MSKRLMNTITIDCGASFIKGALICNGVIKRKLQEPAPECPRELDIFSAAWVSSLIPLVRRMILHLGSGEKTCYLCISNEMHGFLLAYENGTPLTDYISWQKEYGMREVNGTAALHILNDAGFEKEIRHTGMGLRKGLPSCNLLYLNLCGVLEKYGGRRRIFFYTLGDYILRSLSGQNPMCHPTNAAATGLYDITTEAWNDRLLHTVCSHKIEFLQIGPCRLDFVLDDLLLHAYPAVGDQQAALLGSGLCSEDTLSFNLGTGAQVSRLTNEQHFSKDYQLRPYFLGKYIKTVPHIPSGRALNVYFRFVKDLLHKFHAHNTDEEIWEILAGQTVQENSSGLVCDLSFFENAVTGSTAGSI